MYMDLKLLQIPLVFASALLLTLSLLMGGYWYLLILPALGTTAFVLLINSTPRVEGQRGLDKYLKSVAGNGNCGVRYSENEELYAFCPSLLRDRFVVGRKYCIIKQGEGVRVLEKFEGLQEIVELCNTQDPR